MTELYFRFDVPRSARAIREEVDAQLAAAQAKDWIFQQDRAPDVAHESNQDEVIDPFDEVRGLGSTELSAQENSLPIPEICHDH